MTAFYLRWAGIIGIMIVLAILATGNYQTHLASVSPEMVRTGHVSQEPIRVQGMVKSGSLRGDPESGQAEFELSGDSQTLHVQYQGPPPDNLRELKTLILIGQWNPEDQIFFARETALVTNYGFVASAYIVALIGLVAYVFFMSRKVTYLYQEIKDSKLYEAE
ncbi:MAG: cytochrome c maturation protein CcmE [Nitrospirales bacterium]|nr:cytochrome c maturation protein CcmE [Nitrospira sp.]MDR4501712.1 cytochrome c maturation protein CcmE [Nitrospirales bacterium]